MAGNATPADEIDDDDRQHDRRHRLSPPDDDRPTVSDQMREMGVGSGYEDIDLNDGSEIVKEEPTRRKTYQEMVEENWERNNWTWAGVDDRETPTKRDGFEWTAEDFETPPTASERSEAHLKAIREELAALNRTNNNTARPDGGADDHGSRIAKGDDDRTTLTKQQVSTYQELAELIEAASQSVQPETTVSPSGPTGKQDDEMDEDEDAVFNAVEIRTILDALTEYLERGSGGRGQLGPFLSWMKGHLKELAETDQEAAETIQALTRQLEDARQDA